MLDDAVLAAFPPHTHPLTLVSDPDGVLADDTLRAELAARGFRLILDDGDPVALRHAFQDALLVTAASPLVIVTRGPLNALAYDLWQQGRHVTLDLADLFPGLDTSVVRTLSPSQRRRLDAVGATSPATHPAISRRETIAYILAQVFGFTGDSDVLTSAGALTWLARYHAAGGDPLPQAMAEEIHARLNRASALRGWPLDELLSDAVAFRRFVQDGWEAYLAEHAATPGSLVTKELRATYGTTIALPFTTDEHLQDALPALVRRGALRPQPVADAAKLPAWAQLAVVPADAELQISQLAANLDELGRRLADVQSPVTWDDWCHTAWMWAALAEPLHDPRLSLPAELAERRDRVRDALDAAFLGWLTANYAPLAGRSLPRPHHVFHVPPWLAGVRERRPDARVALIVLDGMSLADWLRIRAAWAARHPDWTLAEDGVLAEAPSITAISRLALVAGRRPNTFNAGDLQNRHEPRLWRDFWTARGLPPEAVVYAHLADGAEYPHEIGSHRTQAICLVSTAVDDMVHGATLGAAEVQASLDVWLAGIETGLGKNGARHGSPWLEDLIERLLEEGYIVNITSDHGHVEAVGMGVPSEGVIAATRGKRARLYSSAGLAHSRQAATPDTLLLEDGWLPPAGVYPLVAADRKAFVPSGERVVTHGGLTIEEMIVPLVTIEKKQ